MERRGEGWWVSYSGQSKPQTLCCMHFGEHREYGEGKGGAGNEAENAGSSPNLKGFVNHWRGLASNTWLVGSH